MDKIDKFEKILNLVERARKLDFITIEVMERMNKQHIDFYNFYNKIIVDKTNDPKNQKEEVPDNKTIKNPNTVDIEKQKMDIENGKDTDMTDHNDALKAFVEAFNNQINKCKLNPSGPTPPDEEAVVEEQPAIQPQQPIAQEHLAKMDKIKGYSTIICDRIKTQTDMIKYMQTVLVETHRMAFDMYKDMDDYLKKNPPTTGTTNKV
jgi:hypothetical protein